MSMVRIRYRRLSADEFCPAQIMVTAGANQAFAMVALAVLDPGDRVLLVSLWPSCCPSRCLAEVAP